MHIYIFRDEFNEPKKEKKENNERWRTKGSIALEELAIDTRFLMVA